MNPILALLKENNISDQQIGELFQALTQNPLIDLKRPYKSKPCGGCPARRGGICRCAQKALDHAA